VNKIETLIDERFNLLQSLMESQDHLKRPKQTMEVIESINKFSSVLSDSDKDYINCCIYALEQKEEWNI
jgi:hypothetical protein